MINLEHIFIIHFEPLIQRKKYIDSQIKKYNILHTYIKSNKKNDKLLYNSTEYQYNTKIYDRKLSIGEVCVSIQHFNTYKLILKKNIQYALIIEDDAIFKNNFKAGLQLACSNLPSNFDMCFISECCNLHSPTESNKIVYKSSTSRCVTGYIVNKKCLQYIINSLPFQYPIDWHLNMINKNNELNFYWSEPCLIEQGSESVYQSNLR